MNANIYKVPRNAIVHSKIPASFHQLVHNVMVNAMLKHISIRTITQLAEQLGLEISIRPPPKQFLTYYQLKLLNFLGPIIWSKYARTLQIELTSRPINASNINRP